MFIKNLWLLGTALGGGEKKNMNKLDKQRSSQNFGH